MMNAILRYLFVRANYTRTDVLGITVGSMVAGGGELWWGLVLIVAWVFVATLIQHAVEDRIGP